ncbi:type II CRISPR RNA-guided endonuclease Cas9 [Chryseobacterium sp. MDT2-18]|uniref:type II CRISPR RNA-guided endonuclease Cas9 n=1 Tax=Chryseobacterium sp. MDT2-18 TaxID=1259136 RepID=UPI002788B333|nr:type II CRISPR RNA-guided endonuclease Cas9 [Chryseobacterium sp. MDT2-18]MDQ0477999.1 CRISPR-associated endonuclease Csn1 [Chryseobacterium sp. MDT2-18]
MNKILGVDLGTNSIGLTLRVGDVFSWYGVYTFKKGVGEGKSGEYSFAAERTKHRSSRRLYNARRYRKWKTLKVLIENNYCPLSIENLNKWKHYEKGLGRIFPVNDELFQNWIKLDFDNDGIPDFTSPYQLRRLLITEKLNLSLPQNKYKVGRALYHIAQRRGFKSSRKSGANEKTAVYKGSTETKTIGRNEYENLIIENGSLGAAFAFLEDNGIRVRNRYTLRSDYQIEAKKILEFQNIDNLQFREDIEKAIFFQRPLRSQKGLVGKCTLEPNKARCPISHYKFEEYRAWSFINNIKFKNKETNQFESIPLELRQKLYNEKFFYKSKRDFQFSDVRKFIKENGGKEWELNYSAKMDEISIPSCFVSARLKSVFGENWQDYKKSIKKIDKKGKEYDVNYTIEDIWHIMFSYEDEEVFEEFLVSTLELDEKEVKELVTIFNQFPIGYANLSLKAINNILPFLKQGIIYSESVILAKIPEIIGKELFEHNKEEILEALRQEVENVREEKTIVNIANNLIFKYYALDWDERFAWKDVSYKLDSSDLKEVEKATIEHFGDKTWQKLDEGSRKKILSEVTIKYQDFFASSKREHIKPPHLVNRICAFLKRALGVSEEKLSKIYHPSQIDIYPKKEGQKYLLSPKTAAFKNPMAYKTLYKLRDVINYLIEIGKIDEETRIVVEIARDLNDSNKRWAIEKYQRDREAENREFANAISELINDPEFKGNADPASKKDNEKFRLWIEQTDNLEEVLKEIQVIDKNKNLSVSQKDIQKYRLWKEQNCTCFYTGKMIRLTDLFDKNIIDFEHTIPRSKSFDNSLANLTVCYADYNRNIKKNQMPTELPNYEEESNGYSAIKPHLYLWEKKVEDLFKQIDFWKFKSKVAIDKMAKDEAIRQKHIRIMQYDYWKSKLDRFTRTEIPQGFVNSQLTDTQIITKYAFHYLKTVFTKVDVIKGSNTAEFRKIYEIQPKDEVKDRSKHSHHAIDAAVLTLIPSAKKREEILKKSYGFEEKYFDKQYHEKPFLGFNISMIDEIRNNILINNMADKDQVLTPGKKIVRKRGKVVWIDQKNKIPKVAQGDSVRGELHLQTYYGKIKIAAKDNNGSLLRDESGNVIYNQTDGKDEVWMVLRKPIDKVNFGSDIIVDFHLAEYLNKQILDGVKQLELQDFQGKILRHLRCRVKAARGFMNPDNVTVVKEHVYKSSKDYKNYIYADSGENYMFGLYENEKGEKNIISINKFEASKFVSALGIPENKEEVFKQKEPVLIKTKEAILIHLFKSGQKVIFYNSLEELEDIKKTPEEISKRLYFIKRLHQASVGNMLFQHHLEARTDEELIKDFPKEIFKSAGKDGFSKYQTDFIAPRILFKPTTPNFIIEGKDFEMKLDGTINFNFR